MSSRAPLYLTDDGRFVTGAAIRSDPDALSKTFRFRPLRSDPDSADVIGTIDRAPVILATDLGESPYSSRLREVAFRLPGDARLHQTAITVPCSIPRFFCGTHRLPPGHPLRLTGYFLVLQLTDETFDALDPL